MTDILDTLRIESHNVHPLSTLVGRNHASGKLDVEQLNAYPRVVWVNPSGSIGPTNYAGGRPQASPSRRVRQLYTDLMNVEVHIWGEDTEKTRAIMHAVVAAIRHTNMGSVEFKGYRWVTQDDDRGEFAIHGQKVILEATFVIPVNENSDGLTVIASATHRGDFEPADGGATITGICQT